jgi:hypothetical protein
MTFPRKAVNAKKRWNQCCSIQAAHLSDIHPHMNHLLAVHALPILVLALPFLTVIPDGTNHASIGGISSRVMASVGMMFIKLGEFHLDPLVTLWSFETRTPGMFLSLCHVVRVRGRHEKNWIGKVLAVQYVMDNVELVQGKFWQRCILLCRVGATWCNTQRDSVVGGAVNLGENVQNFWMIK